LESFSLEERERGEAPGLRAARRKLPSLRETEEP
jgi:hypothetical protein